MLFLIKRGYKMGEDFSILNNINIKGYFMGLAQIIPDIIILVDPNKFQVKYINHLQPGFKLEEVIGANVFNFVYPEHIESYQKILKDCIDTGETKIIELETANKDTENPKTWYSCTISPIKNSTDEIDNLLIISKNITSEKLHDIEIQNKQEKIYAILNNTDDIILSIDKNFNVTEYNSVYSRLIKIGYGKTNLTGTNILDFIDPKKHSHIKSIYARVFNGETITDIESFDTPIGTTVYNETSYHPIKDFDKEIVGISVFSKNITERILSEQKLKSTLKEKEVLLSEIHHRIKNNLALVSSMLQLKEMNLENIAAKEALSDSRKRIKSTALVHEMLYRNDTFDNIKLIDYVNELFNNLNVNPNIQLDLAGENFVLGIDKALPFGLMLHELMMNSFKHSFKDLEKAKLKIRSEINNEFLNIEYCDCSGTFPPDMDFNDTSTTGLMLIHTFIEQLNGTIHLSCKQPPAYDIKIPLN